MADRDTSWLDDPKTVVDARIPEMAREMAEEVAGKTAKAAKPAEPVLSPLPVPPPLPFPLARVREHEDAWLEELPESARHVLEQAREGQPNWPLAPRVDGAVATPADKIPHLRHR